MKTTPTVLCVAVVALAGCGGDEPSASRSGADAAARKKAKTMAKRDPSGQADPAKRGAASAGAGTTIVLGESRFGRMLFDSKKQAIYIFERDGRNTSNCYGECAQAWPPVPAAGKPRPGAGVDSALLGTITRRDGKRQVTYAGKPLYYYAHEGPGEVKCHNVDLNGGLWWVMGPDGNRRP